MMYAGGTQLLEVKQFNLTEVWNSPESNKEGIFEAQSNKRETELRSQSHSGEYWLISCDEAPATARDQWL